MSLTQPRHLRHKNLEEERSKLLKARRRHQFVPVKLKKPKWCKHCGYHITSWGLTTHYQCKHCQITVHDKCVNSVVLTCYSNISNVLTNSNPFLVPQLKL